MNDYANGLITNFTNFLENSLKNISKDSLAKTSKDDFINLFENALRDALADSSVDDFLSNIKEELAKIDLFGIYKNSLENLMAKYHASSEPCVSSFMCIFCKNDECEHLPLSNTSFTLGSAGNWFSIIWHILKFSNNSTSSIDHKEFRKFLVLCTKYPNYFFGIEFEEILKYNTVLINEIVNISNIDYPLYACLASQIIQFKRTIENSRNKESIFGKSSKNKTAKESKTSTDKILSAIFCTTNNLTDDNKNVSINEPIIKGFDRLIHASLNNRIFLPLLPSIIIKYTLHSPAKMGSAFAEGTINPLNIKNPILNLFEKEHILNTLNITEKALLNNWDPSGNVNNNRLYKDLYNGWKLYEDSPQNLAKTVIEKYKSNPLLENLNFPIFNNATISTKISSLELFQNKSKDEIYAFLKRCSSYVRLNYVAKGFSTAQSNFLISVSNLCKIDVFINYKSDASFSENELFYLSNVKDVIDKNNADDFNYKDFLQYFSINTTKYINELFIYDFLKIDFKYRRLDDLLNDLYEINFHYSCNIMRKQAVKNFDVNVERVLNLNYISSRAKFISILIKNFKEADCHNFLDNIHTFDHDTFEDFIKEFCFRNNLIFPTVESKSALLVEIYSAVLDLSIIELEHQFNIFWQYDFSIGYKEKDVIRSKAMPSKAVLSNLYRFRYSSKKNNSK